jgi:hypothetical protein
MGGTQRHPGHGQGSMRERSPVIGSSESMILKLASRSARGSRPTARVRRARQWGRRKRTPRGNPPACAGSSARRGCFGSPPGRASRTPGRPRRPAGPAPRRAKRGTRARTPPTRSGRRRLRLSRYRPRANSPASGEALVAVNLPRGVSAQGAHPRPTTRDWAGAL